jgi:hypothetical protein
MLNTEVYITPCKLCAFELSTIICEDSFRHAEFEDYAMYELDCYFLCDVYYEHCLHLIGEFVECDEEKSECSQCPG